MRSPIHFTGRPNRLAAISTSACSATTVAFMPKPPPTSGVMTRSFCGGIFRSAVAMRSRIVLGPCVEV